VSKLLRSNFFRLRKSSSLLLCMAAVFAASVLFILGVANGDSSEPMVTEEIIMQVFPFLPIAYAVFISLFLGIEYQDGTLRNKIICGHSRYEIYISSAITSAVGCFAILASWALGSVVAIIRFGWFVTPPKELLLYALIVLLLTAAVASILSVMGMLISNRAVSSVTSILLMFGLLMVGSVIYNALCEPEMAAGAIMTANGIDIGDPQPNPNYISGTLRAVLEFLVSTLPSGQAILLANKELEHPLVSICSSVAIILLTSIAGSLVFKRKNLK